MIDLHPQHVAFLFPGQGSQSVGMGRELAEIYPVVKQTFHEADEILNINISKTCWEGPEDQLNDTINTQPALLVHSVAVLRAFQEKMPGFQPLYVAGHSMGEVSALVAAKAATFSEALRLVRIRGESMKQAGEILPGGMAAIIGLDIPTLDRICSDASQNTKEIVQVANDNCPGQVVISGARKALEYAVTLSQQAGARRAVLLAVSIAAHSPLMIYAQTEFNRAVLATPIVNPAIPIIGNVNANPLQHKEQIRTDLQDQLTHRVRWTESIQYMVSQGVNTFIEIGNGSVLTGLVKRIDRHVETINLGAPIDFNQIT